MAIANAKVSGDLDIGTSGGNDVVTIASATVDGDLGISTRVMEPTPSV